MFSNDGKPKGVGIGAVTIIGPKAKVDGTIAFSGFLRVQGHVVGDVSCKSESSGTTVVHNSGSITGAIKTPNIVVGGRVEGPIDASESMEIHGNASVVGDAHYKRLAIHEGGVIEGALIPLVPDLTKVGRPERRIADASTPEFGELEVPLAEHRRASDHFWARHKFLIGAALLVVIALVAWFGRSHAPTAKAPAVATVPAPLPMETHPAEPEPAKTPNPEVQAAPVPVPVPPPPPPIVAKPVTVAPAPIAPPVSVAPVAPTPAPHPAGDPDKVVNVEGVNPDKPATMFYVNSREAAVLIRKRRADPGEGTRIELRKGSNLRLPIDEGEVLRVAEGSNLDLFYQGRKVSRQLIESGAWMKFVPELPAAVTRAPAPIAPTSTPVPASATPQPAPAATGQ